MLRVALPTSTPTLRMDVDIVECRFLSCPVSERSFMGKCDGADNTLRFSELSTDAANGDIPNFRAIRNSLQMLQLDNSQLTQLRGGNLKHLKAAAEAFLRQQFHRAHVAADVFRVRTSSSPPHIKFLLCFLSKLSSTVSYFTYFSLCISFTNRSRISAQSAA
ncbi:hypothetical protein CEXT_310791 [Caerostris extrusa]|uniref:Uncharacterized protein n=1 Tax=Caerostris extrusa TaxID=172846 RepID=A0AAV4S6C2_CAEEX|nr:hypothetical protein CEXT_310791 [Caerostris extrusa]